MERLHGVARLKQQDHIDPRAAQAIEGAAIGADLSVVTRELSASLGHALVHAKRKDHEPLHETGRRRTTCSGCSSFSARGVSLVLNAAPSAAGLPSLQKHDTVHVHV